AGWVDLRVREHDPTVPAAVGGEADQPVAEPKLVPVLLRNVDHLCLGGRALAALELVGSTEILDQLARHVRLPWGAVVGEAPPVRGVEPPGLALVEVREDLAGAAEDAAVLGHEDGGPVAPGDVTEPLALVRPGLDLAGDEVDPELGQHLA